MEDTYYRVTNAALAAFFAAGLLALTAASVRPDECLEMPALGVLPHTCPYRLRGLPCSTCGLTRSCVTILDGDWEASRTYHPLGVWVVGFLAAQVILRLMLTRKGAVAWWRWDAGLMALAAIGLAAS
ncbi:MAG: DUF2752 domain-containing protein [Planctomycetales bacterium]|nr:DUF2752 domain-containing protein [Planctomycetales bacterium]